jgi:hypothetical protein
MPAVEFGTMPLRFGDFLSPPAPFPEIHWPLATLHSSLATIPSQRSGIGFVLHKEARIHPTLTLQGKEICG